MNKIYTRSEIEAAQNPRERNILREFECRGEKFTLCISFTFSVAINITFWAMSSNVGFVSDTGFKSAFEIYEEVSTVDIDDVFDRFSQPILEEINGMGSIQSSLF